MSDYVPTWSGIRADLLGVTGRSMTCAEFARKVLYVLTGVKVPRAEWDSTVRTPSEIMGKLTQLFYERDVTDVEAHLAKIVALAAQLENELLHQVIQ